MQNNSSSPGSHDARESETPAGDFTRLLREIEKEAVPERLLELALALQAALVEQRRQNAEGDTPAAF